MQKKIVEALLRIYLKTTNIQVMIRTKEIYLFRYWCAQKFIEIDNWLREFSLYDKG